MDWILSGEMQVLVIKKRFNSLDELKTGLHIKAVFRMQDYL